MNCDICDCRIVGATRCPDCRRAVAYMERRGVVGILGMEQVRKLLRKCKLWLDEESGISVPYSICAPIVVHDLRTSATWINNV